MTKKAHSSPTAINDRGLLLVKGPDAKKFLQGQVTCDINALSPTNGTSQTSLGAHCTPKGRMLFSFRACELAEDAIGLCLYKPLLESALNALKKYSIFSKLELSDASEHYQFIGCYTDNAEQLSSLFGSLPKHDNDALHSADGIIIRLSASRYECWLHSDKAIVTTDEMEKWTLSTIEDGLGEVR
ncbi:MAG: folate-binding protein, partial [Pseudomonadota bacterium]